MASKKSKPLTKQDVKDICNKMLLVQYTKSLATQLEMLRKLHDEDSEEAQFRTDVRLTLTGQAQQNELFRKHLTVIAKEVLAHDYLTGRITKAELTEALQEVHKKDMLAVVEQLEELDQDKDKFVEHMSEEIKRSKKKRNSKKQDTKEVAMLCYHANENPATCPCPKKCYCKDKTCLGKVSW